MGDLVFVLGKYIVERSQIDAFDVFWLYVLEFSIDTISHDIEVHFSICCVLENLINLSFVSFYIGTFKIKVHITDKRSVATHVKKTPTGHKFSCRISWCLDYFSLDKPIKNKLLLN